LIDDQSNAFFFVKPLFLRKFMEEVFNPTTPDHPSVKYASPFLLQSHKDTHPQSQNTCTHMDWFSPYLL
jgi:hypothetical protein